MFRNMVTSLFKHEHIRTTDAKAKELKRWADNMITLAKRGDLHARRQALSIIREKDVVYKLFEEAPERFGSINGGYTRVVKLTRRAGDAALISMVELVGPEDAPKKDAKEKTGATTRKATVAPEKKDPTPSEPREEAKAEAPPAEAGPEENDQQDVEKTTTDETAPEQEKETDTTDSDGDAPEDPADAKDSDK